MIDKLQETYNTLIRHANLNYEYTNQPMFKELHEILLGKSEAFEDAANLLSHKFPVIKTTTTNRWNEIREHHMQEEETEEPKEKAEA